jgi:uncharacterized RDD family membrane protein YckC
MLGGQGTDSKGAGMSFMQRDGTGGARTASGLRAGFWRRLVAVIVDGILVGIPVGLLYEAFTGAGYVLGVVLAAVYFVFFEGGPSGQTFGKKSVGIRVVDLATGGPIGYARAVTRYLGRIVSSIPLYLGYLWMLWDAEKQCWHDKFAGSVVVPDAD